MLRFLTASFLFAFSLALSDAEDLVLADFESVDFERWIVRGEAFGAAPASLDDARGEDRLAGVVGSGYASSFRSGDNALTGSLTGPRFKIDRPWISFSIGGGNYPETALQLLVDGEVVRTSSGSFIRGRGDDNLRTKGWDVREFMGEEGRLRIIDQREGRWGRVFVDHVVHTDAKPENVEYALSRDVQVDADYLQLPLTRREYRSGPGVERLSIENSDGELLRYLHVRLANASEAPEFWHSVDLRAFRGQTVTLQLKSVDQTALESLKLSDEKIVDANAYGGRNRPRFHYSPRSGWMNDINGPYWKDGYYHIFHQYNPTTAATAIAFDMHWGHAVSRDLVHWEEWPIALFPNGEGQCYSGSSWLIERDIPGMPDFQGDSIPALFFTATGNFSQHLAFSKDGGRTWLRHASNPIVDAQGIADRDPKVFWHEGSEQYVMILFNKRQSGPLRYMAYRSTDLLNWESFAAIENWYECPDFFQLYSPERKRKVWVLYGSYRYPVDEYGKQRELRSAYQLFDFDGNAFTPLSEVRQAHEGPRFYGALTFVNEPKDRTIMMGWVRGARFPGEPFNQCATVPLELSLELAGEADALLIRPANEIETLRRERLVSLDQASSDQVNRAFSRIDRDTLLDLELRIVPEAGESTVARIRELEFRYDPEGYVRLFERGNEVAASPIHSTGGPVEARFLLDRGVLESFWNRGEASFSVGMLSADEGPLFELMGEARVERAVAYRMAEIWSDRSRAARNAFGSWNASYSERRGRGEYGSSLEGACCPEQLAKYSID